MTTRRASRRSGESPIDRDHRTAIDSAAVWELLTSICERHVLISKPGRPGSVLAAILVAGGCAATAPVAIDHPARESLLPLMPRSVRIVRPFTTWADLDGAGGLDGISVYVQPINAAGDPIHTAGHILVELFAFRPASADHKGERQGVWDFPLESQADQDARWNRATRMYELPVALPSEAMLVKPATRYVLAVTLNPPLGDRRFDEYILEAPPATSAFASQP